MAQDMNENAKIRPMNTEQKYMTEKLEGVLNFLKSAQIENEEALVFVKKPLEELESSLKYVPVGPSFARLPDEIKRNILNLLCDSNAFTAASVCEKWKAILENRFIGERVTLGKPNSSCLYFNDDQKCEKCSNTSQCVNPEVMLKALTDHKFIHLEVRDPIEEEVNSKLVAAGLTSASSFSLSGDCTCPSPNEVSYDSDMSHDSDGNVHFGNQFVKNPLSAEQFQDLLNHLEKKEKVMERVDLLQLDLTELNQDTLADCLINKVKRLTLKGTTHGNMLNFEPFLRKLSEQSSEIKLNHLTLRLEFPKELARQLANALCNVEFVEWNLTVPVKLRAMKQLFQNVLTRPVKIKKIINWRKFDCRKFISPEDLKKFLNKMIEVRLFVRITREQIEAAKSLPDVRVCIDILEGITHISKGV